MCQLVLLVIPVLQCNEDAQVMRARLHAHTRPCKLCAQLVKAPRADSLLGTVNVKGRDGRVMRRLFGEVRDCDGFAVACDAVGAARGRRGGCAQGWVCLLDFPVALGWSASVQQRPENMCLTLKNSPRVEL